VCLHFCNQFNSTLAKGNDNSIGSTVYQQSNQNLDKFYTAYLDTYDAYLDTYDDHTRRLQAVPLYTHEDQNPHKIKLWSLQEIASPIMKIQA